MADSVVESRCKVKYVLIVRFCVANCSNSISFTINDLDYTAQNVLYIYRDTRYIAIVRTELEQLQASPTGAHSASGSVLTPPNQTVAAGDFGGNMTTTPETIAELRRLLAEATPGPWQAHADMSSSGKHRRSWLAAEGKPRVADTASVNLHRPHHLYPQDSLNAALIAAAVNALPSLLSDLEAAQKALAEIRELAENSNKPTYLIEVIASTARHALAATEVKP
jgi:hypothetical protein